MSDRQKVLLVDDDQDLNTANRVALEAAGFQVFIATDSKSGAAMAAQERPDLIIADLMMENLDAGFSLVEELAAHEKTSHIPVIMLSGVTTSTGFRVDEHGQKPSWLHVKEFINKPIDPVVLADKVAAMLRGSE